MNLFKNRKSTWFFSATTLFGILALICGFHLASWTNDQVNHYNKGVSAYQTLEFEQAVNEFNFSLNAYRAPQKRSWLERFVYPAPSRELAANTAAQKGNALIMLKRLPEAVDAYKDALRLNPSSNYQNLPGFENLTPADITRLKRDARIVKYNLELLLRNNIDLQNKKGDGNQQEAKEEEEKEQIPQLAPGGQPGTGDKEDI